MSHEDLNSKINEISQLLAKQNDNIDLLLQRAIFYFETDKLENCLADASKVLSIDPMNLEGYYYSFESYWGLNQPEKAELNINKCIEAYETHPEHYQSFDVKNLHKYYHFRGVFYKLNGNYNQAIKDLNKAITINKYMFRTHLNLGQCYYELKDYETSIKTYKNALDLMQTVKSSDKISNEIKNSLNEYLFYLELGLIHFNTRKLDLAENSYSRVIELTNGKVGYSERAQVYLLTNDLTKAMNDLQIVIKDNPQDYRPYDYLGRYYMMHKDYAKATDSYTKAIDLGKKSSFGFLLYFNRGNAYYYNKDYKHAIEDFSKTIELNDQPDHQAHVNRGNCYSELKQYKKALDDYFKAVEIKPDYITGYRNIALTCQQLNDKEKAIQYFEKCLSFDQSQSDIMWSLALLYFQKEKPDYLKAEEKFSHSNARQTGKPPKSTGNNKFLN